MTSALDFITRGVLFQDGKILGDDADTATLSLLRDEVERRKALIRAKAHYRTGCRHCGEPWPTEPACPLCARAVAKVADEDRAAWTLGQPQKVRPRARRAPALPPACPKGHVLVDNECPTCAKEQRATETIRDLGRELRETFGPGRLTWLVSQACACGSSVLRDGICVQCGVCNPEHVPTDTQAQKSERARPINQSVYHCKACDELVLHTGRHDEHALNLYCKKCSKKTWVCRYCGNRIDTDPCVWCRDGNGGALRKVL